MKLKTTKTLVLLLVLITTQFSFAQTKTISGTVSDNSGPLPGVTILIKGTTKATISDFDGNYTIKAKEGNILEFSYVGYTTFKSIVGKSNSLNVSLKEDAQALDEVVVTALGIKREKRALGYASQKVTAEQINATPSTNLLNNLSGKVAGLQVKNNSNFGGSTNIVLRGSNSLTGNNQALMVIDGVPMANRNLNADRTKDGSSGYDYGNSASDIDPNNIESINVLKGAAATALYGSEAANGAIMITTKKGKKNSGIGVTINSTVSMGKINKSTFTNYQKQYGGGGYVDYDDQIRTDVNGDGTQDLLVRTGYDISYGVKFDKNRQVYQWNAFAKGNPNYGKPTPWLPAKNDPTSFFRTSYSTINNINLNGGGKTSTFNLNFTNNSNQGVLPNSTLKRNILSGKFTKDFTDKFKVITSFSYTNQNTIGRNSTGYGDNILTGFRQWWQTNVDIKELKQEYFRSHENVTWNMNSPKSGNYSAAYWNNPYFDRYENYESDSRNRLRTNVTLSYDITPNLNILGRATINNTTNRQEQRKQMGSHAEYFGVTRANTSSGYELYTNDYLRQTYGLIANYKFKLNEKISGNVLAGGQFRKEKTNSYDGSTAGGLIIKNLYTLPNSSAFVPPYQKAINYEKSGLYAQSSIDYNRMIYLEGSFRRDQSTSLAPRNNTYNYYSIGSSFVFSELVKTDWLSFGKLRANYAEVGNDPAPGTLGYKNNHPLLNGKPMISNSKNFVNFNNLKPERTKSWEIGLETKMLKNRLGFNMSYYVTKTVNQIFKVPQSGATGYYKSQINAGAMQNKGLEIVLTGSPIKTKNFEWNINVNWARNRNTVLYLNQGRSNLQLALWQSGPSLNATVGQPYGTIRGIGFAYDSNGNKIVNADGSYKQLSNQVIGNIQAKWTGGVSNSFRYKNLSANFLIDMKEGGSIYSLDQGYGQDTGLPKSTTYINDLGKPVRNTLANGGGYINPGVVKNADGTYTQNTTRVDTHTSSEQNGSMGFGITGNPAAKYVYDASYVKLRQVGLTYALPNNLLKKSFIKGMSFSLLGNNLWIIHKNLPDADPEAGTSSGNIQGFQSGVSPSVKVYSFKLQVKF